MKIFKILLIAVLPAFLIGQTKQGRISGYLHDASTGEPIMYANIVLVGTDLGAASTVHGYYVIPNIPNGRYTLRAMMIGYRIADRKITITASSDTRIDFDLEVEAIQTEEVTVTAERTRFKEKVEISRTNLSMRDIKTAPAFIESDVFRSLQLLPSVGAQNDFSSAPIVRGGSPDENLILLDGIEIYNPYHIGGVFSTFNADAISDAEFLAGGFPAEFGGRLSSVLQITSREGNSKDGKITRKTPLGKYWDLSHVKGEISALSSKATAEGPFYNGSWILSARRTYFDQLAKIYYLIKGNKQNWQYYFWDTQFKVLSDLTPKHRLTFSSYRGSDKLAFVINELLITEVDFDWTWGNSTSTVEWRYVPNSKFYSELTLAKTRYLFDVGLELSQTDSVAGSAKNEIAVENEVSDWTLKEKLTCYLSSAHTLTMGFSYKTLGMNFKQILNDVTLFKRSQSPYIMSLFLQDKWKINALLSIQMGLRINKYELHKNLYLDPRIGFKYNLTENTALKGIWGLFSQFLFTTNDEDEILRIVDFWEPVPKNLKAQKAQHFVFGIEQWFSEGFTASIEGYYKPYSNILDINPNNNPAIDEDDFIAGKGESWGIELLFKKSSGKLTGWFGYSYSLITKRIDFNSDGKIRKEDGEIYLPSYHRPHNFNLVLNYRLNKRNALSLTWSTATGQPYTPVIGKVYTQSGYGDIENPYNSLQNIEGEKNSAFYPMYLRGDIGYIRNISPFGIKGRLKLQIINFTNHFNVLLYSWDHSKSPSKATAFGMFPIIPTLGLEFEF